MTASVAILGYGMGNVTSLLNAFSAIGADVRITASVDEIGRSSHLVIPGVGAFRKGMEKLAEAGLIETIHQWAMDGRPLLGVCLGMQLLATVGEEHGVTAGLGLIDGSTTLLRTDGLRIPHIGWNDAASTRDSGLLGPAGETRAFYFVHSFHLAATRPEDVSGVTEYGQPFAAAVERDNVCGVQFHPEKSHASGLEVLRRFIRRS